MPTCQVMNVFHNWKTFAMAFRMHIILFTEDGFNMHVLWYVLQSMHRIYVSNWKMGYANKFITNGSPPVLVPNTMCVVT